MPKVKQTLKRQTWTWGRIGFCAEHEAEPVSVQIPEHLWMDLGKPDELVVTVAPK